MTDTPHNIPLTPASTVIVGAGAAGMACAVQLVRQWRQRDVEDPASRVLVVTAGLPLGASRMSGSDKQTYYKLGTSPRVADTAEDFARALTAFGCCHGDLALVEGLGSLRGFHNLIEAGVPFPHDADGAFIGYKTDHDPYERATSAGPKTSRFMAECLERQARELGVRIIYRHPVIDFVCEGEGDARRIVAMVCFDLSRRGREGEALHAFAAENWVLAAGGSGGIYRDTVYPPGQTGLHGAALLAGLEACNLSESQFGLASISRDDPATGRTTGFRWNVSGTYMQAIPRIFSTDAAGRDEREFLTEYFPDMPTLATAIFLKGYQWPFDAERIVGHGSSLIDMAVHQETVVRGRRVWMDFRANPVGPAGEADGDWEEFHRNRLGDEAVAYLDKTGALQATPIERLRHMNPPAVEIYAEHGIDLTREPLEIALCAQHMNGGFAVDKWWRGSIPGVHVIGEMAGTHGVKRPGGSALNAGQVGAMRAAEFIANARPAEAPDTAHAAERFAAHEQASPLFAAAGGGAKDTQAPAPSEAMAEIRERMTRFGAHLRSEAGVRDALEAAVAQYRQLVGGGLRIDSPRERPAAVAAVQQCLTHAAILHAIAALLERGGGSRGSYCVLDDAGIEMHPRLIDPSTHAPYRFRPENETLRREILHLRLDPSAGPAAAAFTVRVEPPRPIPHRDAAFEVAWADFRAGRIYEI